LIEAEGCFHLGFTANDNYKNNYQVALMFTMSLHVKDEDLLIKLKDFWCRRHYKTWPVFITI